VQLDDVVAKVDADCVVDSGSACGPTASLSGRADLSPVGPADVAVSGAVDLADGMTTLVGDAGRLAVAPLVVDGAKLQVVLDPASGISTTAEGTSSVLGAGHDASVDFGVDAVVAVAELGDRQLVPGWTLDDTVALAADIATIYPLPDGTTVVPVTLTPGTLTGAATTSLPADLADGVLPADLSSGVVTFPIDGPAPSSYLLTVPAAGGWDVIGGPADPAQVTIDDIGFLITADGNSASVQVQGNGSVRIDPVGGGAGVPVASVLSGALSTDGGTGVLDATITATSPMADALGVTGLTFDGTAVSVVVSDGGATATLTATTQLPPALAAVLGGTPPSSVPVSGAIDASHPCVTLDLDVSGGVAVNPGGSGLLSAANASIALAPTGCEDRGPAAGMSLQTDGAAGAQQLEIDPGTFALSGVVELGSAQVGGVPLQSASVAVDTTAVVPYAMSGQMVLDDVGGDESEDLTVAVSGPVLAALNEGGQGVVQLSGGQQATTLTVGSTQLSLSSFAVAPTAILGSGTAALTAEATVPLLGGRTSVSLAGSVFDGTVQPLSGTVPAASYPLVGGDSLQAAFGVDLGPTPADSSWTTSIVSSPTAVLQVEGFSLTSGTATITDTGMTFDGQMPVPGIAAGSAAAISGPYTLGAADPSSDGDLQLTTASSASFSLAGFSAAGTATLSRSTGTFSATQSATVSPGLFDSDTSITVTGDLVPPSSPGGVPTATLTNADPVAVALRGLEGTATLTFTPGTGAAGAKGWYDADLQLVSSPDACDMWGSPPTLTGQIYRSGTTTYYTLTTWVQPSLVAGLVVSPISGAPPQPVMLSNEVAEGEQPAPGVTVQLGVQSSTFTGQGILSLSVGSCSYTIGATVMLTFGGGSQSAALGQNFGGAQPALTISSQLFGTGQSLPEAIALVRREYQLQSLAEQIAIQKASLEQAFEQANQQADAATKVNEALQAQAAQMMDDLEAANERLAAAQQELADARTALQTAAAQQDVDGAETDVEAAAQRVATAQTQVSESASQLWDLNEVASDAGGLAEQAEFDQMVAEGDATTAGSAVSNYEKAVAQQEAQQKSVKTLQITVEYTHCTTCEIEDTASLDGELYFAETYIAGIDLTVEWGEGQLDEVMGTFSVGWLKQYTVGWSHLYLYGMVEVEVELTVGWDEQNGWDNLDIGLDATADITAYLDLWFATYSATLAEVELDGTLALLPSPAAISGSATIDVFGFSDEFSFGPSKV
jgi:hypothetical protein